MIHVWILLCVVQYSYSLQQCSPWAQPSNYSGKRCVCRKDFLWYFNCENQRLHLGKCLTYDNGSGFAVVGHCPYVTQTEGDLDIEHFYAKFPQVTTIQLDQINNITCGPLNRQGLLCEDCIPGNGPTVYAFGFTCADCSEMFSGWAHGTCSCNYSHLLCSI